MNTEMNNGIVAKQVNMQVVIIVYKHFKEDNNDLISKKVTNAA